MRWLNYFNVAENVLFILWSMFKHCHCNNEKIAYTQFQLAYVVNLLCICHHSFRSVSNYEKKSLNTPPNSQKEQTRYSLNMQV